MGSGKTTVGRALARELGWAFVDVDSEVSRKTGMSIPDIFSTEGEQAFRRIEVEALRELVAKPSTVIACGGGIVTSERGCAALTRAFVVYLAAAEKVLFARLERSKRRPLLAGLEGHALKRRIHELLVDRRPLYAQVADIAVDAAKPTAQVVRRIVREMAAHGYDVDRG